MYIHTYLTPPKSCFTGLGFFLPTCRKKKSPRAGFKSKKVQPQEDSDEVPIITNIDDPWQEESEEDEKIGVSINPAGKGTELVVVENGVKREDDVHVHASHVHVKESATSKSSHNAGGGDGNDDGSPKVQVEAEIMPEMVPLSVIAQQSEQDETAASGEVTMIEEGQREATATAVMAESEETHREKKEGGGEGAGTTEPGPVVVIEESADPIVTIEIQVSGFLTPRRNPVCVSYGMKEIEEREREGEKEGRRESEVCFMKSCGNQSL